MRVFTIPWVAAALAAGGLVAVAPPAASWDGSPGSAQVVLNPCRGLSGIGGTYRENCSFVILPSLGPLGPYVWLTADGPVTWNGDVSGGGALTFPAAKQVWPTLTQLTAGATAQMTASDIDGSLAPDGEVRLNLRTSATVRAMGYVCRMDFDAQLTSRGTEPTSRQREAAKVAVGEDYDPRTGRFAVVSTAPTQVTTTGSGCASLPLRGPAGIYLAGTLAVPGGNVVPERDRLDIDINVAKNRLAEPGEYETVIRSSSTQDEGNLVVRATCAPAGAVTAGEVRYCQCKVTKRDGVKVRFSGVRKVRVRVVVKAIPKKLYRDEFRRNAWRRSLVVRGG
jgi:hypothetical protein